MWRVAADLVQLANTRIRNGEYRPIPYSQRFGGLRLDFDPSKVRKALNRLEDHGVIENAGVLARDQANPFEMALAPKLWVLRVQPVWDCA
jgi:hypothetical protein